jgi:hypothetical protein
MNIQTVVKHLEVLGKIEGFSNISEALIGEVIMNRQKVKDMKFRDYKMKIKSILLEFYYINDIDIKYKDLNLLYFINPLFGIFSLDLIKLDAWLYNKLLDVYGHKIHSMSGYEKLKAYTNNNHDIMRWI